MLKYMQGRLLLLKEVRSMSRLQIGIKFIKHEFPPGVMERTAKTVSTGPRVSQIVLGLETLRLK